MPQLKLLACSFLLLSVLSSSSLRGDYFLRTSGVVTTNSEDARILDGNIYLTFQLSQTRTYNLDIPAGSNGQSLYGDEISGQLFKSIDFGTYTLDDNGNRTFESFLPGINGKDIRNAQAQTILSLETNRAIPQLSFSFSAASSLPNTYYETSYNTFDFTGTKNDLFFNHITDDGVRYYVVGANVTLDQTIAFTGAEKTETYSLYDQVGSSIKTLEIHEFTTQGFSNGVSLTLDLVKEGETTVFKHSMKTSMLEVYSAAPEPTTLALIGTTSLLMLGGAARKRFARHRLSSKDAERSIK